MRISLQFSLDEFHHRAHVLQKNKDVTKEKETEKEEKPVDKGDKDKGVRI